MANDFFADDWTIGDEYGEYSYLTYMATHAWTGAPEPIFQSMAAKKTGAFKQQLDEHIETVGPNGDDPLADYIPSADDDEEVGPGTPASAQYDIDDFFGPPEGEMLQDTFDDIAAGSILEADGLIEVEDIVSSTIDKFLSFISSPTYAMFDAPAAQEPMVLGGNMALPLVLDAYVDPIVSAPPEGWVATPSADSPDDIIEDEISEHWARRPPEDEIYGSPPWAGPGPLPHANPPTWHSLTDIGFLAGAPGSTQYDQATEAIEPLPASVAGFIAGTPASTQYDQATEAVDPLFTEWFNNVVDFGGKVFSNVADFTKDAWLITPGGVIGGAIAQQEGQQLVFDALNTAYPDIDQVQRLVEQSDFEESDILAWMASPDFPGDDAFLNRLGVLINALWYTDLQEEDGVGDGDGDGVGEGSSWYIKKDGERKYMPDKYWRDELGGATGEWTLDPNQEEAAVVQGGKLLGMLPEKDTRTAYNIATENLRAKFFNTIYQQKGVGQASYDELNALRFQTQLLFFLENGETAWQNVLEAGEKKEGSALESNYATYLDEYLARPFAQRLGPDFYSLVKDVSDMFTKSKEEKNMADWSQADQDKKLWVDGLFGEGQKAFRDQLVKMGLTHGGMGYYSSRIHMAAQNQMQYYRDIGWPEERIFAQMTKGMKKPQAAQQPSTNGKYVSAESGF